MTLGLAPVVVVEAGPPEDVLLVLEMIPVLVVRVVRVPLITEEMTEVVGVTISVFSGPVLGRPLGRPVKMGGSNGPDVGTDSVKNVRVISPVTVSGLIDVMSGVRVGIGVTLPPPGVMFEVNSGSGLNGGE